MTNSTVHEIENFSNYFIQDCKVYKRRKDGTNVPVSVYWNKIIEMKDDKGMWQNLRLNPLLLKYSLDEYRDKIINQLKEEYGVQFYPLVGIDDYLFTTQLEDEKKLYSISTKKFIVSKYRDEVLKKDLFFKISYNYKTINIYYLNLIWQNFNNKKTKKGDWAILINPAKDISKQNIVSLYIKEKRAYEKGFENFKNNIITKDDLMNIVNSFNISDQNQIKKLIEQIKTF